MAVPPVREILQGLDLEIREQLVEAIISGSADELGRAIRRHTPVPELPR